jgi:hypothetical protein
VWLLGLIGVLALVLPLSQVLRFQIDALAEDRAALARLDPLAEALAVQRGLIEHDSVADRVLRGRSALEGERRLRQATVDQHLAALRDALPEALWPRARREADGLRDGWTTLVTAIAARRIAAEASGHRHRLLQEQAVQVMDLLLASQGSGKAGAAAGLEVLDARRAELQRRIARHEATQALVLLALGGALVLPALALLARRHLGGGPAGPAPVRRSHGRRAGDRAPVATPAEIAAAELQAVLRGVEDARSD